MRDAGIAIRELPLTGQLHAKASRRADMAVEAIDKAGFGHHPERRRQARRATFHRLEAIVTSAVASTPETVAPSVQRHGTPSSLLLVYQPET